jgi:hypothetical protein
MCNIDVSKVRLQAGHSSEARIAGLPILPRYLLALSKHYLFPNSVFAPDTIGALLSGDELVFGGFE